MMQSTREEHVDIIIYTTLLGVCPVVGLFGIVSNIINIIIFNKLGFSESINVSLLGLALSDLLALLFIIPFVVFINPYSLYSEDVLWNASDLAYIFAALPNGAFNRVTCLVTVFITVERCLCFVMPLRVKSLVTPVRSAIIVAVIFLVGTLPLVPQYMATQLAWRPEPGRNKSLLGVVLAKRKDSVVLFQIANVMNLSMQLFSTAALVVANIALAVSVKKQEKWRLGTAATTAPQQGRAAAGSSGTSAAVVDSSTYRNKRLARMIQFLSLILFGAFFSSTLFFLVSVILPAFDLYGEYSTEFRISWMFALIAQTLNSSVNIVFYYRMNSRFRNAFNKMFRRGVARVGIFPADHNTMDNTIVALSHRPRPT